VLTLSKASAYADSAIAAAERAGVAIAVCVVNDVGTVIQLDRMDQAVLMSVDLAEAKALTSLNFGIETAAIKTLFPEIELAQMQHAVRFPLVTISGGAPLYHDGQRVGAIGVSGGSASQDAAIAAGCSTNEAVAII
jgi:uncharacterized protein GlcG (DUF336 family)